jgi:hypothetical protein
MDGNDSGILWGRKVVVLMSTLLLAEREAPPSLRWPAFLVSGMLQPHLREFE